MLDMSLFFLTNKRRVIHIPKFIFEFHNFNRDFVFTVKTKLIIVEKCVRLQNFTKYKISVALYIILEVSKDMGKLCMTESMLTFDIILVYLSGNSSCRLNLGVKRE